MSRKSTPAHEIQTFDARLALVASDIAEQRVLDGLPLWDDSFSRDSLVEMFQPVVSEANEAWASISISKRVEPWMIDDAIGVYVGAYRIFS